MAAEDKIHKVLIVDDELMNIELLKNLLRDETTVIYATTGEEALTIAKSNRPDLVLLDIMMPGMDGYQVCRELKKYPKTEKIPVIFITSRDTEHEEAYGLELGAVDYITKPFNAQIVKSKVKNHLAQIPEPQGATPRSAPAGHGAGKAATSPMIGRIGMISLLLVLALAGGGSIWWFLDGSRGPAEMSRTKADVPLAEIDKEPGRLPEVKPDLPLSATSYSWVLQSRCEEVPYVSWWNVRSRAEIVAYVNRRYAGDWKPYIDEWTARLTELQDIYAKGGGVRTPGEEVLTGESLRGQIIKTRKRLDIILCLSREAAEYSRRKTVPTK